MLPFLFDTVSFLGSMVATRLTRPRFQSDTERVSSVRAGFTEGFVWLRRRPFFATPSVLFALGNPVCTGLHLLARHYGAGAGAIGGMFALIGVGGVLEAVVAAPVRRRLSARLVIVGEDWLLLLCVLLLARSPWLIGALVAAAESVTPIDNSLVAGSRIAVTPDRLRGRVSAISTAVAMSLAWLGPLAVGFAFARSGSTAAILILAGWTVALASAASLAPAIRAGPPHLAGSGAIDRRREPAT